MTNPETLALVQSQAWISRQALEMGGLVPGTVLDRLSTDEGGWKEFAPILWPAMKLAWKAVRAAGGQPERLPVDEVIHAFTQGFVHRIPPE